MRSEAMKAETRQAGGFVLRTVAALALGALAPLAATSVLAQSNEGAGPVTGNPQRGENLFTSGYKCYACHGFDGQTGQRRLVPTNYTEEGFITFVRNSPLPQMPVYADVPPQDLADIYAYIRSLPVDAPAIEDLPLLEDILARTRESMRE